MLPRAWATATIDNISTKVAMGPFGSSIKVSTFVPDGIPVISGKHLHGFRVDDKLGFNFISPSHAKKLANANVQSGDVVFTHAGTIGQVAYIPPNSQFDQYVISQRQFYLRCDLSAVIPEFLTLYFRSPEGQHKLLANSSQVGVPSIAQPVSYLRTIEVPLPSLPEQHAIADVFGTLEDKIEINRRMNDTLEEMAQTLFKSWFVDFDPVLAKIEGRWQLDKSLAGLPVELYDLFPERLIDSEIGPIPEGWKVVPVGEAVSVKGGTTPKTKEPAYWNGRHYFATPKDLSRLQDSVLHSTARRLTDAGIARIGSGILPSGSLLLSSRAPIGYLAITQVPVAINQGIIGMICHGAVGVHYALHWTRANMRVIEANASGTTFSEISKSSFRQLPLLLPPPAVHAAYELAVAPLHARVALNGQETKALTQQRDLLLPRLLSGDSLSVHSGASKSF